MRLVRYNVAASLDGFIATEDGGYDWIPHDDTIDFVSLFKNVDTVLLGRTTYELVLTQPERAWSASTRVYVFSSTLRASEHPDVTVVPDRAAEVVAALRAEPGTGDIWLFGGAKLFSSLLAAGQVDRIEISVAPVLLGSGIPVNMPRTPQKRLALIGTTPYPSGLVTLNYRVEND
ncbi:MAG: dihydrofolate reductase [Gemmatimonadaceae bacterium]|nr:dihydrofolate reductase [Gemmatimonadaceae bacterium]